MQLGPTEPLNQPKSSNQTRDLSSQDGQDPGTADNDTSATSQEAAQGTNQESTQGSLQESKPSALELLMDKAGSGENLPNILFIGGVILLVILSMRLLMKNTKANRRRDNNTASPSQRISDIHQRAQGSMDPSHQVMIQAEEMARRLGATLDNKAARLELLIDEADRKLATLNQSLASTQRSLPQPVTQPDIQPVSPSAAPEPAPRTIDPSMLDRARVEQDIEDRQSRVAGRIEPELNSSGIPSPDFTTYEQPTEPVHTEPKTTQELVIELAQNGLSNIEIAHQLGQPIGQVELILNLQKKQGQA